MKENRSIQEVRSDGLIIFIDDDEELNITRRTADKKTVIAAVALRRAQQIAKNYCKRYAPEIEKEFTIKPRLVDNRRFNKQLKGKNNCLINLKLKK